MLIGTLVVLSKAEGAFSGALLCGKVKKRLEEAMQ